MRDDELQIGVSVGKLAQDEMQGDRRVLEHRSRRRRQPPLPHQRGAQAVHAWMKEDHCAALVECGVDRVEAFGGHGFVETRTLQGHADHAQFVEAPIDFGQRLV